MPGQSASPFTPRTLTFLRTLARHNEREWFRGKKDSYERDVHGPMIALLARLALDLPHFGPEFVSEPRVSLFRIYRDTRFSADKSPLKTSVAARFPSRAFPRHAGAGLYVEIGPRRVWMGGGLYRPSPADLRLIRTHMATAHRRLHRIVVGPAFRETVGTLEGERLTRVPRGYPADHPAADYLRFTQLFAGREFPAAFATTDRFYPELLKVFATVTPLVRFLNDALRPASATMDRGFAPR